MGNMPLGGLRVWDKQNCQHRPPTFSSTLFPGDRQHQISQFEASVPQELLDHQKPWVPEPQLQIPTVPSSGSIRSLDHLTELRKTLSLCFLVCHTGFLRKGTNN